MPEFAVNVADLTVNAAWPLALAPYLTRQLVNAEPGNLDGLAVSVSPETPLEQFAALVLVLRGVPGGGKNNLRIYRRSGSRWARIEQVETDKPEVLR